MTFSYCSQGRVRSWPGLVGVLVAFVLQGSLACRRAPEPSAKPEIKRLRLGDVEVLDANANGVLPIKVDAAAIEALLRSRLKASGLVETNDSRGDARNDAAASASRDIPTGPGVPPDAPVLRVRVRHANEIVELETRGRLLVSVSIRLDTRPSEAPGALNEELSATGERNFDVTPTTDRRALVQATLAQTAKDLLDGFLAHARLMTAGSPELHRLIREDGPLREEAVRQVGTRKLTDEGAYIVGLLNNDSEPLRDAALGALIQLREPRTVRELTRTRSMRDRREMRKILEAISILGGQEAHDYLAFVVGSHDDEEIRTIAREALARLERRVDAGMQIP